MDTLSSWVLLDTVHNFPVPQFPLLPNRVKSNAVEMNETMGVVCSAHGVLSTLSKHEQAMTVAAARPAGPAPPARAWGCPGSGGK